MQCGTVAKLLKRDAKVVSEPNEPRFRVAILEHFNEADVPKVRLQVDNSGEGGKKSYEAQCNEINWLKAVDDEAEEVARERCEVARTLGSCSSDTRCFRWPGQRTANKFAQEVEREASDESAEKDLA